MYIGRDAYDVTHIIYDPYSTHLFLLSELVLHGQENPPFPCRRPRFIYMEVCYPLSYYQLQNVVFFVDPRKTKQRTSAFIMLASLSAY